MSLSRARRLTLSLPLLSLLVFSACSEGGGGSPTESAIDALTIESVSPPTDTPIRPGSQVTFSGRVRYTLVSEGTGFIVMIVSDLSGNNLSRSIPQPNASVRRGSGTIELRDTIQLLPGPVTVRVTFALFPGGAQRSTAFDGVTYTVR